MYDLEAGLEDIEGTLADDLKLGDLAVVVSKDSESVGQIVLRIGSFPEGLIVNLSDPSAWAINGHLSLKVRKLAPGESITLTVK